MFYGEKLHEIREMFSYTRKDLADELQLNEQLIWEFETNQTTPNFLIINNLKKIFSVRSSFFFLDSYLENISETSDIAYRKKPGKLRNGVKSENVFLNFLVTHIKELEQIVYPIAGTIHSFTEKVEKSYNLTQLSLTDLKKIAEDARENFDVISNKRLMYYLELSGIYIIERDLEDTIDAYSSWILNDAVPVIILNNGKNPAVRRNFDMAHELGHLLLHKYVDFDQLNADELDKIEKEANLFASYFTLPHEELKTDFFNLNSPTDPKAYIELKRKYRMSIQAIAYRANQEGWLSKKENRLFWKRLHQLGYKLSEPLDSELTIHIPGKIRALLSKAIEINDGLVNEWLEKYSVDVEYFEKTFGIKDDLLKKHLGQKQSQYFEAAKYLKIKDYQ